MNKQKIAFLICGEIRSNSLGGGKNIQFEDTFKQNVLSDEVMNGYEVNIFFVTDKIIEEKAYAYFGEHLKGLLQLSFQDIPYPLNLDELVNNYMQFYNYRQNNPTKCHAIAYAPRPTQVHKFYKIYAAYTLMKDCEIKYGFKHDYIINTRPDIALCSNLYKDIENLKTNNLDMILKWDWAYFGRYDIMCHICKLVLCYGKYNYGEIEHDVEFTRNILTITSSIINRDYLELNNVWNSWSESPEVQLVEHILSYAYINNIAHYKFCPEFNQIVVFEDRK